MDTEADGIKGGIVTPKEKENPFLALEGLLCFAGGGEVRAPLGQGGSSKIVLQKDGHKYFFHNILWFSERGDYFAKL
jgi:hypothetical protein